MATAFEELGLMTELSAAVADLDWLLPTDIQAEAVPLILGGGDVLMAAETGSGKTGAFCMPILQTVWETINDRADSSQRQRKKAGASGEATSPAEEWRMSLRDREDLLAVSGDGMRCQCREQHAWFGCRAVRGVRRCGRWYYEATVIDEGLCRVGWSSPQASLDLGTDKFGYGYGGTGKKSNNRQFDSYGRSFGKGDVIGCYLDLDQLELWFSLNGDDLGQAFSLPKAAQNDGLLPAVVLKNAEIEFNFGARSFSFPPGYGYQPISAASSESVFSPGSLNSASSNGKRAQNAAHAIIVEPSRELAEQTGNQLQLFGRQLPAPGVRHLVVVGGVPAREQRQQLRAGVDIVVATPGRLMDLVNSGDLDTSGCRFLVLDEVDALIKQGHEKMVDRLHASIPKVTPDGSRLQMIVCSATLHSPEVTRLAGRLMYYPTWVDLKGQDSVPDTVHHVVALVDPRVDTSWTSLRQHVQTDMVHAQDRVGVGQSSPEALSEAVKLLKAEYCVRAIVKHRMDRALIFCRTKLDCDNLERYLKQLGDDRFSCVCLHSDRSAGERQQNLEMFRSGQVRFLICTDVAARGLDIRGLPFTINCTLPDDKANYVHRIGRVGRAERMGLSISLVSRVLEKVWYHSCASRGRNCADTRLAHKGGCCIWYDEPRLLADIEEHLGVTIDQVDSDLDVPVSEFDGRVVYGQKRSSTGAAIYADHVEQMSDCVAQLASLEKQAQTVFIERYFSENSVAR